MGESIGDGGQEGGHDAESENWTGAIVEVETDGDAEGYGEENKENESVRQGESVEDVAVPETCRRHRWGNGETVEGRLRRKKGQRSDEICIAQ